MTEVTEKYYALNRDDGGVSIIKVIPVLENQEIEQEDGDPIVQQNKVIRDVESQIAKMKREGTFPWEVLSYTEIQPSDVPADRYFRSAWNHDGQNFGVDMEKARDVHMQQIRKARNEKLAELDIETMKGNDVQAEKQALRDLPQTFDLSVHETPEELKAAWPTELS